MLSPHFATEMAQKEEEKKELARLKERMTGRHSKQKFKQKAKNSDSREAMQNKMILKENLLKKMNTVDQSIDLMEVILSTLF